jgi:hypothetical protein
VKLKGYQPVLTAEVNRKGVLDIDVVKGCPSGIVAHGPDGCYGACYAAKIARFRGLDFSRSVVRKVWSKGQARSIEQAVKSSEFGFFRIGTMGDPSLAWGETVRVVRWLAPHAIPVIVTKHWRVATDDQLHSLVKCGAIINTSISALDRGRHLWHRIGQLKRYKGMGGTSVARIVSCDFNTDDPVGNELAKLQMKLFSLRPLIDNPLRVSPEHELVRSGVIRVRRVKDLQAITTVSVPVGSQTYLGHCSGCDDLCGAGLLAQPDIRPPNPQMQLFTGVG